LIEFFRACHNIDSETRLELPKVPATPNKEFGLVFRDGKNRNIIIEGKLKVKRGKIKEVKIKEKNH